MERRRGRGILIADEADGDAPHAMILLLARVMGIGIETADLPVNEVMTRRLRDRRATPGSPGRPRRAGSSGVRRDFQNSAMPAFVAA
jgi:transposase